MPPKKGKGKKKGKKVPEPEPESEVIEFSDEEEEEKELDLLTDLNDDFFSSADKTIQNLMQVNRAYEASKIKKYIDIIFKLHRKYVEEVRDNEILRPQISRAETKLRLALEMTLNSEEAMRLIKESLAGAWKENDASLIREQDIQEKLQEVLIKCESLESKDDKKLDDSAEFGHLAKYKNIILRERDRLNSEVTDLEKRLQMQRYYSESVEYMQRTTEDSLNKLTAQVHVLESEKGTMHIKIRNLRNNLEEQKDSNAKTVIKYESTLTELNDTQKKLDIKSGIVDRQKIIVDKLRNENLLNKRQLTKTEDELADCRKIQKDNEETIRALRLEDKVKGNVISLLTKKHKKALQDYNNISSKLYKLNRLNHNLGEDIARLKNQINAFEKDLLSASYKFDDLRRYKENVQRERDTLRHDIAKLNNYIADLRHTIMIQVNTIDGLHLDVNKLNVKLDEAKISIQKATKERDELAQEIETMNERLENYKDQMTLKTEQITDLTEKLQKNIFNLINVKKQLETVHSEKMVLKRSLETCTQERDNFRTLQTKTTHQTTQLTNEIAANQNTINGLNLKIERLNSDKKELQSDIRNKENLIQSLRNELKEMKSKNEYLLKVITEDERKLMKISQQLEETRKEKNLVGLQMVRRNDEIVLLKEKMNITQTALDKGQTQYNMRVEDIRLLKVEIINLQNERDCLSRALKSTADMRQEILRLQRLLNQERIKVRSFTEDAKTPTGIHRWRILKGEDPNKYQLIEKVQSLQRRNLKQEIEKENVERQLKEVTRICESLKRIVENLPGRDVKRRLVVQQRVNRVQLKKLKALNAELNIDQVELKARECIIEQFKEVLKSKKAEICATPEDNILQTPMSMAAGDSNLGPQHGACYCQEDKSNEVSLISVVDYTTVQIG